MTAECAQLEVEMKVPLKRLEEFLHDFALHMDEDAEYNEIGRFESWFLDILTILVDDASRALALCWRLSKKRKTLKELGRDLSKKQKKILRVAREECASCLDAIKEVVEEPAARILRGMGFLYHRIVEFVCERPVDRGLHGAFGCF